MEFKDYVRIGHRLLTLIFWMIVGYLAGDIGMGFYFASMIIYQIIFVVLIRSIRVTVADMVSNRRKQRFHDGATRNFRIGLLLSFVIGVVVGTVFWFGSAKIITGLYGYLLPSSVLGLFGVYFFIGSIWNCLLGYYMGQGGSDVCHIIELVQSIILVSAGPVIIKRMYVYGAKVAALLKEPLYSNLNGAIGAVITQIFATFIAVLIVIAALIISSKNRESDFESRGGDKRAFTSTYFSYLFYVVVNRIFPILAFVAMIVIYSRAGFSLSANIGELYSTIGVFAGKYLIVLGFPFIFFVNYVDNYKKYLRQDRKKLEDKTLKARVSYLIKTTFFIMLPACVTVVVLAKPIVMIFFGGKMSLGVTLVRQGGVAIIFAALGYACKSILQAEDFALYSFISELAGFVAMLVFMLPSVSSGLNVNILVFSVIVYFTVSAVVATFLVFKINEKLHIRLNALDIGIKILKIVIAAVVLAVAQAMFDKFLVMNVLFLLLTLVVSYALYYVVLAILGGISDNDVNALDGSFAYYPAYFMNSMFGRR